MEQVLDLRLIRESDIIFVPICLTILSVILYVVRQKYRNTVLFQYFMPAIILRYVLAIAYALVIQFYYGYGDTSLYYNAIIDLRNALSDHPELIFDVYGSVKLDPNSLIHNYFEFDLSMFTHLYMQTSSNYMVPRFALPFSLVFGNSYLCICFCLCVFSFGGCWRVFKMFCILYPHLHKKIAIAVLFLPSVLFWGGSLLKDSICLGALGYTLYGLYMIFFQKRKIFVSVLIVLFSSFLLFHIKPYILLCLIPSVILWLFLQFKNRIQDKTLRQIAGVLFALVAVVAGVYALQAITQTEMASQFASDKIVQTVQGTQDSFKGAEASGSTFSLGGAGGSAFNLIMMLPLGLVATLFRPFLWESGSPLMATSAIESTGFLVLTFLAFSRIGIGKFFKLALTDSAIVFCMVYSLFFAAIVGITTSNFGALVRYKIPCIPFYLLTLFLIMDKSGKFSPGIVFSKKFF